METTDPQDGSKLRERVEKIWSLARSEVRFAGRTYPRSLRRHSISTTRYTCSYRRWVERQRRKWTAEHHEMFGYLREWSNVWGDLSPDDDGIRRSGHTTRVHAWDDRVRPTDGQTNDEQAHAFLPSVLKHMTDDDERLIACTVSWSGADGTRPKPLREFGFLDQAYWRSTTGDDEPGECLLTHVFASMTTSGSAVLQRVARVVVHTEAVGVLVMPTDLRWVAYLYFAGVDFSAIDPEDVERFERAAVAAGGRPSGSDSRCEE